jgi:PKD repeat protein
MTSNSAPAGNTSLASSEANSISYPAWKAFDHITSADNGWVSNDANPAWIQIHTSRSHVVEKYSVVIFYYTGYPSDTINRAPRNFTLQGSNDNSTWTNLDIQTGITWTGSLGETKSYEFTNAVSYAYYRLDISAINGGAATSISELMLYERAITPSTSFLSFNNAGYVPFTTYLYDNSTDLLDGDTFFWMFGDGNTSTSRDLFYTWNLTGTYSVNHSVSSASLISWENKSNYIAVGTPTPPVVEPVASFYGSPTTGNVPLTVYFTDVSSNTPTSWFWEFGDGTNSTAQNPNHSYTRSGFRTVNLTASNSAGSNITVRSKFVKVS